MASNDNTTLSSTPSDESNITNPFDSPLMTRLSSPVCRPGIFDKTDETNDDSDFEWSITELALLKPVDIDTESFRDDSCVDPAKEAEIQEKISNFFRQNTIIRSPPRIKNAKEQNIGMRSRGSEDTSARSANSQKSDDKEEFLPEDVYEKILFPFESQALSTPKCSIDSLVQLSPVKELSVKGLCDEIGRDELKEWSLSPISIKRTNPSADTGNPETNFDTSIDKTTEKAEKRNSIRKLWKKTTKAIKKKLF